MITIICSQNDCVHHDKKEKECRLLTVPAWEECEDCHDVGRVFTCAIGGFELCPTCAGEGGKWHEAVEVRQVGDPREQHLAIVINNTMPVTKSSLLIREHKVCSRCDGAKENCRIAYDGRRVIRPCSHCPKDADANPTGAEPGTATPWRVKEAGRHD